MIVSFAPGVSKTPPHTPHPKAPPLCCFRRPGRGVAVLSLPVPDGKLILAQPPVRYREIRQVGGWAWQMHIFKNLQNHI